MRVTNALLVAATMLWLMVLCRRVSGSLVVALGVGIFTFFGLWHILSIRPQTLSLLLFVALYDMLERFVSRASTPADETGPPRGDGNPNGGSHNHKDHEIP